MRVHLLQVGYDDDELIDVRRERVAAMVRDQRGADLVVLPELWAPTGFDYTRWAEQAEPLDGPTVQAIAGAAREIGAVVHAGSIIESVPVEGGAPQLYNTSVLLDRDGSVQACYRKIHRFGFGVGEPKLLEPGEQLVTVDITDNAGEQVRVGLATCYDLRFPEMFRALLDLGVRMVLIPAAWPAARVSAWTLLGQARAIENQVVVVQVNTAGTHARTMMGGRSQVVDAMGTVLASAGVDEEILTVDLPIAEIEEARRKFPVLADRRL